MGLAGILVALFFLIWLSYRGGSVLLLAPAAALAAAAVAREPLLATWTQTFMGSAAQFVAQFFPIFLLGAVFGKLMEDSNSVSAIAQFMMAKLGPRHAVLAVALAGALVTYGGVSLFVAFFVLAPMAEVLFRTADIPHRLMPAALALGTSTFTMSALPGTPAIQNAIPMPFFGTTPFAAPGLGVIASAITLGIGLWWLNRAQAAARRKGEGYGRDADIETDAAKDATQNEIIRERATLAREFDLAELTHGRHSAFDPPIVIAALPLVAVVCINLAMSLFVLPRLDFSFLAQERWGSTSLSAVGGVWAVVVALAAAIVILISVNYGRLPALRESLGAGANASVLPAISVASLVGFGAVVAALPGSRGRPAGLPCCIDERARRAHRLGLGRTDDSPRCTRRYLYAHRRGARHRSRGHAPGGGDRCGHARQFTAQWCSGDAACHLRINPSPELSGYRYGGDRQRTYRSGGCHYTGFDLWLILSRRAGTGC
jgi:H+/gluconate symporter-like permease